MDKYHNSSLICNKRYHSIYRITLTQKPLKEAAWSDPEYSGSKQSTILPRFIQVRGHLTIVCMDEEHQRWKEAFYVETINVDFSL